MSPLVIDSRGARIVEPGAISALRAEFRRRHSVCLADALDPVLLSRVQERIDDDGFEERVHGGIDDNLELSLEDGPAVALLHLLFNGSVLHEFVETVTGAEPIRCFTGRIYRMAPGAGHHDAWHDDLGYGRRIAMSLNLGGRYEGGILQIRERDSGRILEERANDVAGGILMFRLSPRLQHRVTDVSGSEPKTAFAGWFRSYPDYWALVRGEARLEDTGLA